MSGQGLVGDVGSGSMSPYGEPHYGAGYSDSSTPPHTGNPPQKKKASSPRLNDYKVKMLAFLGKAGYALEDFRAGLPPTGIIAAWSDMRIDHLSK